MRTGAVKLQNDFKKHNKSIRKVGSVLIMCFTACLTMHIIAFCDEQNQN